MLTELDVDWIRSWAPPGGFRNIPGEYFRKIQQIFLNIKGWIF